MPIYYCTLCVSFKVVGKRERVCIPWPQQFLVSFPNDFLPSIRKSTSENPHTPLQCKSTGMFNLMHDTTQVYLPANRGQSADTTVVARLWPNYIVACAQSCRWVHAVLSPARQLDKCIYLETLSQVYRHKEVLVQFRVSVQGDTDWRRIKLRREDGKHE